MHRLLAFAPLAAVLALGACSTLTGGSTASTNPIQSIATFTLADLKAADADAVAQNDTIAHACYPSLEMFVQGLPGANGNAPVAGGISAFQEGRDVANTANVGIPTYLKMACAPLLLDDQTMVAKLAALAAAVH